MDDGSYGGTTAAEGPRAQELAELLFDLLSRWLMPSVRRRHRAAMAAAFRDAWSQMERHGDGGEEEDDDDDDAYGGWLLGAVPASGDAMAALPETTVGAGEEECCCAVCLEEYAEGDALRTLPCAHGFHGRCILGWLRVSRLYPLCRFALPAKAGTDSDSESEDWWEDDGDDDDDDATLESVVYHF